MKTSKVNKLEDFKVGQFILIKGVQYDSMNFLLNSVQQIMYLGTKYRYIQMKSNNGIMAYWFNPEEVEIIESTVINAIYGGDDA